MYVSILCIYGPLLSGVLSCELIVHIYMFAQKITYRSTFSHLTFEPPRAVFPYTSIWIGDLFLFVKIICKQKKKPPNPKHIGVYIRKSINHL